MTKTNPPVVLVTGARGGIGRALCSVLHAQGWRVAAVGRDPAAASACGQAQRGCSGLPCPTRYGPR
jgi:NAD(P)-dependent dehydrogenase (short-subunit alcohol dehydrogenase family)